RPERGRYERLSRASGVSEQLEPPGAVEKGIVEWVSAPAGNQNIRLADAGQIIAIHHPMILGQARKIGGAENPRDHLGGQVKKDVHLPDLYPHSRRVKTGG